MGSVSKRDSYELDLNVYGNKETFEPYMVQYEAGPYSQLIIDGRKKGALRTNYVEDTYEKLSADKQTATWHISATDTVTMPILKKTLGFQYYY